MSHINSNTRIISRGVMASAIAMTLGMTLLAQDSARLRMERKAFERAIEKMNPADVSDATAFGISL